MMRLKIAFRNIVRNRGRSSIGILMIAGSVLGIVSFRGFSGHILHLLKDTVIDNRYNHIQVATQSYWNLDPGPRKLQLLSDPRPLMDRVSSVPGVTMVSARLGFFGLISNGETTISAQGVGYDPAKETHLQKSLSVEQGRGLQPGSKSDVVIGAGLQKRLNAKVGDTLTVISYTLDGVVNAADLRVAGIFRIGTEDVDAHVFMLPLASAQTLLDTDAVESVTVRLAETDATDSLLPKIDSLARSFNSDLRARSWYEISDHYRQIERFYRVQNNVIETILVSLVILSILNSVGMSVYERTGEIGTVRALGERPSTVVLQFLLEGSMLGLLGIFLGWLLSAAASLILRSLDLKMVLPNASFPVPIRIELMPQAFLVAGGIGLFAAVVATLIPSLRASRLSIVEALRRNI